MHELLTLTAPIPPSSSAVDIVISAPGLAELARAWPVIEPILKRATDRVAGYEPIDLLQLVMVNRMSLYLVRDRGRIVGAAVTEVRQFPRSKALEVPFIAGTGLRHWWRPLLDVLDAQARACGCTALMGWDRKGWARYGFRVAGVALVRELEQP